MMRASWKVALVRTSWILLAGLALANSGCLAVVAGAAAAGGVATYAYLDAEDSRSFPSDYGDVNNAVHAALRDLSLPVESESEKSSTKSTIESLAADKTSVKIKLITIPSQVPGEKNVTRVTVRVGTWGDHDFSERILDQVSAHLGYTVPGGTGVTPPVPLPAVQQASWQTPGATTSAGTPLGPPPAPPQSAEPPAAKPG